ncbi:uncharacterized protein TNCT_267291 [Trichonephila clavata]|uniref:DUF5641 domain-containing protein n=1 Tax=Trichonephila clavata TaxID=2740835 RepID=A0A8X6JRI4_TRICU|nr:uncharacterized protein TNCT_267291 [Trichonephila clavata]
MEVLLTKHWRQVPSKENPADITSRGIEPKCLPDCMLWWQRPPWLRLETFRSSISSSHNNTTPLTFSETKTAKEPIIRWIQGIHFQEEIQNIKKQTSLPLKSPLHSLHPFIDEHGLVRVGGRLQNSQLRFHFKPLSYVNDSDIEYIYTLTPSHFLTDDVVLSVPEGLPSVSNHRNPRGVAAEYQKWLLKEVELQFLSSLQPRKKWQVAQPNLKEDDIVLIKEEGPPGK